MATYPSVEQTSTLETAPFTRVERSLSGTRESALIDVSPFTRVERSLSGTRESTILSTGIPIPTGSFRRVHVELYDEDGNPLTDARWVQSAGIFPTAAPVNDQGEADMWLLETRYDEFIVLADSGRPGVDYVWYSLVDESDGIGSKTTDAKLYFEQKDISGLWAGRGVDFGGMLG